MLTVQYSATGVGARATASSGTTGTTVSWNHTFGPNDDTILIGVNGYNATQALAAYTRSATVGGVSLTELGALDVWQAHIDGWGIVWGLSGAAIAAFAGTTQSVVVNEYYTAGGGTNYPALHGDSVSYVGGADFVVSAVNQSATSLTVSVNSGPGHRVFSAFVSSTIAAVSGTSRYLDKDIANGYEAFLIQDQAGAYSSVAATATTTPDNGATCNFAVDIIPSDACRITAWGSWTQGSGTATIASLTGTQVTLAGDDILVAVTYRATGTISGVTCDGSAMTLVGTLPGSGSGLTLVTTAFYRLTGASAGSHTLVVSATSTSYMCAQSVAVANVGRVATQTASGGGSSMSQSITRVPSGGIFIHALGTGGWNGSAQQVGAPFVAGGQWTQTTKFAYTGGFAYPGQSLTAAWGNATLTATLTSDFWTGFALLLYPVGYIPTVAVSPISRVSYNRSACY